MATLSKDDAQFSIVDAVEVLVSLADLEPEPGIQVNHSPPEITISGKKILPKQLDWLNKDKIDDSVDKVKDLFHVILDYLQKSCKKELNQKKRGKMVEGVKTIMVVAGEAAKKLDRYISIIHGKEEHPIVQSKEYKQLEEFYWKNIDHKLEQNLLAQWVLNLSQTTRGLPEKKLALKKKELSTKHVFIDLDTIKKDSEYELLFLRKEDGSRFLNPRLIRNIKLVCDFGEYLSSDTIDDPLKQVADWQERACCIAAEEILEALKLDLNWFYHEGMLYKDHTIITTLNKMVMALMLAANPTNLLPQNGRKCCSHYFSDFQFFFRQVLQASEYQKWIVYPPKREHRFAWGVLDCIQNTSNTLTLHLRGMQEMFCRTEQLLEAAREKEKRKIKLIKKEILLHAQLAYDYTAMAKLLSPHATGPLVKFLKTFEQGVSGFDSIMQGNIPNLWYELHIGKNKIVHSRIPSPTRQTWVHKAAIIDEFASLLLSYSSREKREKHLLINLQDRTSWREFARCHALETLQENAPFNQVVKVVTLATDTEFYHQIGSYNKIREAAVFIQIFCEHLSDQSCGFFFPEEVKKAIFPSFINSAMQGIHQIFFQSKKELSHQERLDFISLFYLILQLKLVDLIQPHSFSICCKDGVDTSTSASALLFVLLNLVQHKNLSDSNLEYLNMMLYGPSILLRERCMLPECFNRTISAIKTIELTSERLGFTKFSSDIHKTFDCLFTQSPFKCHIVIPKPHELPTDTELRRAA